MGSLFEVQVSNVATSSRLKKEIRARMLVTGEKYNVARRKLLAARGSDAGSAPVDLMFDRCFERADDAVRKFASGAEPLMTAAVLAQLRLQDLIQATASNGPAYRALTDFDDEEGDSPPAGPYDKLASYALYLSTHMAQLRLTPAARARKCADLALSFAQALRAAARPKPRLVVPNAFECPGCREDNVLVLGSGDPRCRACGYTGEPTVVADRYVEEVLGFSKYRSAKDGDPLPIYNCPSCEYDALVNVADGDGGPGDIQYLCFSCGEAFGGGSLEFCTECNEPRLLSGEIICSSCFAEKVGKE